MAEGEPRATHRALGAREARIAAMRYDAAENPATGWSRSALPVLVVRPRGFAGSLAESK